MTKQEFMAMSLPYELVITDEELQEFPILTGIEYTTEQCLAIQGDSGESDIDSVMPVLHPLSDLVKHCLEGKLIPIVELAKIYEEIHGEIKTKQVKDISACLYINSDEEEMVLAYHWKTQSFGANTYLEKVFINVHQQLPMFQKLVEWHFDIAGLIEKGEAIDVNNLEENPYK